jgi:hypothetical protein
MLGAHNVRPLFLTVGLSWISTRVGVGNGTAYLAVQPLIVVAVLTDHGESGG